MVESINLIPQEEVVIQRKELLVKQSTVFSILLTIVVIGISGFLYYSSNNLTNRIKTTESEIQDLRSDISAMPEIEISARNLYAKYTVITNLLDEKIYYSSLLAEFRKRTPETILIEDFSVTQNGAISVSGKGDTYLAIAQFMRDLTLDNKIFTSVSLNSVNLLADESKAEFLITVNFDSTALKDAK